MKKSKLFLLIIACAFLAGCETRSISDSAYRVDGHASPFAPRIDGSDSAFTYRGELSEFDVLGITRGQGTSDHDIQQALDNAKAVRLAANTSILLIQSGAMFPDTNMVAQLSRYFRVNPFSGVPPVSRHDVYGTTDSRDPEGFSQSLRLAAARGGNDVILCYWGILETAKESLATKDVSWVPLVGWMVPDEKQHMRIRLKVAVIDVRSGNWSVLSPEAFDDSRISASITRGANDQRQVELLKAKAYEACIKDLVQQYSPLALAEH